jgi:phosphoribosyl 1,2-cyclic phosphodiesterase
VNVTVWGTRGSIAAPGPDTLRYGGNTSCVEVESNGTVLVLDAGSGIRRLGTRLVGAKRVDVLLTHLHMDHIQGLGFFAPLYVEDLEVHLWGPASATLDLRTRLSRYLSPPLFPVMLRDLPCRLSIHEVPRALVEIGPLRVRSGFVCHPGPTVGFRIETDRASIAYLPDHEPALGVQRFPQGPRWTSGHDLAMGVDLLVHDAQYTDAEYPAHVGWGHSSLRHAIAFAAQAGARHLVPFHHDPAREDDELEASVADAIASVRPEFPVTPAAEGATFELP